VEGTWPCVAIFGENVGVTGDTEFENNLGPKCRVGGWQKLQHLRLLHMDNETGMAVLSIFEQLVDRVKQMSPKRTEVRL
jgi:hypothetical protein